MNWRCGFRWIGERSVGPRRQGDGDLVDTVLVVESSFRLPGSFVSTLLRLSEDPTSHIPAPVQDSPQHASIAPIRRLLPGASINSNGTATAAQGVTVLVPRLGGHEPVACELLVGMLLVVASGLAGGV